MITPQTNVIIHQKQTYPHQKQYNLTHRLLNQNPFNLRPTQSHFIKKCLQSQNSSTISISQNVEPQSKRTQRMCYCKSRAKPKNLQTVKKWKQVLIKLFVQDIKSKMLKRQNLAYEVMLLQPQQYIAHQFTKLKTKQVKTQAVVGVDLLTKKFLLEYQLYQPSSKLVIKNLNPYALSNSVQQLNSQLKQKLSEINSNISTLNSSRPKQSKSHQLSKSFSLDNSSKNQVNLNLLLQNSKKTQQSISTLLEFRQHHYWQKNEQKTKNIKQFLQHHQKQQQQRHKRYQQSLQKSNKRIEQQKQLEKQSKLQQQKQILKKGLEKCQQYKEKRQAYYELNDTRIQQIQEFLEKINIHPEEKRLYQIFEQKWKEQQQNQRQQYKQKLQKIKQAHQSVQKQQIEEHLEKYMQQKQSIMEELRNKKQQHLEQVRQISQELRNLFRSKKYQKAKQQIQTSPYKRSMSQIVRRKSKRKQFAVEVKEKYKPKVSQKKRQELEQSIRQLQLSEDKSKRKVFKNGQVTYEDKAQYDPRQKGIQYLAFLKKYLEDKPKKQFRPISTSLLQSTPQVKKFDYLRQNKPTNVKFKSSLIQWKRVMDDNSFKPKDKYTFLKQSISTLEHKAIEKQIQARNLKKSPQQLEKKEMFDKFYLESIQAKMAILNNLMLGGVKK